MSTTLLNKNNKLKKLIQICKNKLMILKSRFLIHKLIITIIMMKNKRKKSKIYKTIGTKKKN